MGDSALKMRPGGAGLTLDALLALWAGRSGLTHRTNCQIISCFSRDKFMPFVHANASTAVNWKAAIVNSVALSSFFMIFLPRLTSSLPNLSSIKYRVAEQYIAFI